jgi:O-antigen ligase
LWFLIALLVPVNYALPPTARALWFVALMAAVVIPALFMRVERPLFPVVWVFAGYASVVALLTATRSTTIADNVFVGLQLLVLLGFGVFTLTYNATADRSFSQRVGIGFLIGQTVSATVAVAQLMGVAIAVPGAVYGAVNGRSSGLAEHPNTLGIMATIAILISLQALIATRRLRLLTFAVLAANVLGLVASGSLTAMLALSVGLGALVLCMRNYLGRLVAWAMAFAAAFALAASATGVISYLPSLAERYVQVTGQSESTSSWGVRTRTYEFAWDRISQNPIFGNGLSTESSGTFNGVITVHNAFLRSWYQGGLILGIAFTLIMAAVLVGAVRAIIARTHGAEASVLIAVLVYASVSPLLEQRQLWLPVLVAWASISAARCNRRNDVEADAPKGSLVFPVPSEPAPQGPGRPSIARSTTALGNGFHAHSAPMNRHRADDFGRR